MLPTNSDGTPVCHEFFDGHPGTEAETYIKLKSRIEFRIIQEQNQRQAKSGIRTAEEYGEDTLEEYGEGLEEQVLWMMDSGLFTE